ncbi:uncharacterized protein LOC120260074 [Dioscorea cayenensis subsp. rotundata]|uniref:Uncharacterized protein LOC120260074 n=1 Tax=Dioscorea cayennensis subsp. rotundata TaxID=55577 RepID=A0AB40B9V6_DIOCR|nr:uncharacterized protein LOC120260074 [Dioscorea cayenensis subsp. rotundata]
MENYKKEWKKTGCTLMSDGWSDRKNISVTNFLVNSPSGTVFLKSVDTSDVVKDAQKLFELLDSIVEEIGEENVVHVVTDSASAYVAAGDLNYSKKKELKRPGVTRFATSFLTLKSIDDSKLALRAMFASEEWARCSYSSKMEAKKVEAIFLLDDKFWKSIKYCLKCASPLIKVLRLVDGDAKPTMGYIYEAMDRAKEQIAQNFNCQKARYERIWHIIDTRWDLQLHRPLHVAGYFLNPKFQYSDSSNADMEVKMGLYKTIEKMYPDLATRIKIDQQLEKFKKAEGLFGMSMAILTREKKQPALWWESYEEECKELQNLAIRVLSLTCSATGCERNWSTFEHVHSKERNRLEQQRLNALVFVKYNIQLELRQEKREKRGETYDPICLSDMEGDDEWITEVEDACLPQDNSWMDMNECFEDDGVLGSNNKRKREPRNLKLDRKRKRKAFVVEEEVEEADDDDEANTEEEEQEDVMVEDEDDGDEGLQI